MMFKNKKVNKAYKELDEVVKRKNIDVMNLFDKKHGEMKINCKFVEKDLRCKCDFYKGRRCLELPDGTYHCNHKEGK